MDTLTELCNPPLHEKEVEVNFNFAHADVLLSMIAAHVELTEVREEAVGHIAPDMKIIRYSMGRQVGHTQSTVNLFLLLRTLILDETPELFVSLFVRNGQIRNRILKDIREKPAESLLRTEAAANIKVLPFGSLREYLSDCGLESQGSRQESEYKNAEHRIALVDAGASISSEAVSVLTTYYDTVVLIGN